MRLATKVIGIGSHHGDDRAGWIIAQRLRRRTNLPAQIVTLRSPTGLLDQQNGCDRLILIDTCVSGDTPGSIKRLEWPDVAFRRPGGMSTHGLTLADALRLAERLDRLPREVVLFVIEGENYLPGEPANGAMLAGLEKLEALVLAELNRP
jgi:hydrogenase maturation protease